MRALTHRQILVAANGILLLFFLVPDPAHSVQQGWVDQIAHRVQLEERLAGLEPLSSGYERYLTQLQSVRQALVQGQVSAVQSEMGRFVRMVATKEGGIADSSAQSLLLYIGEVTPPEYLDVTTTSHLRLIREKVTFRADTIEEVPAEASYSGPVTPQTTPWAAWPFGWMGKGTVPSIITLGAGVLVLVAVGVIALLFVGLGGASANGRSADHTKDRTVAGLEKKTHLAGSSRGAA
jgi:hypothetical protein